MTIEVTGLMHAGIRIGPTEEDAATAKAFYADLLGLETDGNRPISRESPVSGPMFKTATAASRSTS